MKGEHDEKQKVHCCGKALQEEGSLVKSFNLFRGAGIESYL